MILCVTLATECRHHCTNQVAWYRASFVCVRVRHPRQLRITCTVLLSSFSPFIVSVRRCLVSVHYLQHEICACQLQEKLPRYSLLVAAQLQLTNAIPPCLANKSHATNETIIKCSSSPLQNTRTMFAVKRLWKPEYGAVDWLSAFPQLGRATQVS